MENAANCIFRQNRQERSLGSDEMGMEELRIAHFGLKICDLNRKLKWMQILMTTSPVNIISDSCEMDR